ncbi:MAG: InlB B-repeat-containing protein, partial [Clostridiales bacterium]|nr:InlB B-repeat-containing protein [Clostridiales bacterium]
PAVPPEMCTVTFNGNGAEGPMDPVETIKGSEITLPANGFTVPDGMEFAGWKIGSKEYEAGDKVTVDGAITVYAVWAAIPKEAVTDTLDHSFADVSGTTYADWSLKQDESDALYSGNSAGGNDAIQLRDSNKSGIISTLSGGRIVKVVVDWNSNTADQRQIDVYGKNTPYDETSELYDDEDRGTLLGSIVKGSGTTLRVSGDYKYIGIRSNKGALYLDSIKITWDPTYPHDPEDGSWYTVSFDTGEGGEEMSPVKVKAGDLCEVPYCWSTGPDGTRFDCWQLGDSDVFITAGDKIAVTGDIVLKAVYKSVTDQPDLKDGDTDIEFEGGNDGRCFMFEDLPQGTVCYRVIQGSGEQRKLVISMGADALNKYRFGRASAFGEDKDEFYISLPAGYELAGETGYVSQGSFTVEYYSSAAESDSCYQMSSNGIYTRQNRFEDKTFDYKIALDSYGTHKVKAVYNDAAKLEGYSLSLGGDIGVNFYMSLSDDIRDSQSAYMLFTSPDGTTSKVFVKDIKGSPKTVGENTYYVFSCGVSARFMSSPVTAQLYVNGSKFGDEMSYSVREYADYLLNPDNKHPDRKAAENLVKAMLNYGAYAQVYFGVEAIPANETDYMTTEEKRRPESETISFVAPQKDTDLNGLDGVAYAGSSLSLKSETTLSLYFTSDKKLTFECSGRTVETATAGIYQVARITDISASDIGSVITLTVSNSSGQATVKFSPLNYIDSVIGGDYGTDLENVVKALYIFYDEAVKYIDQA